VKIGSLFSGCGGLDMAVEAVTGGKTAWVSDVAPGANKILAHRYPEAPNIGDITAVDWAQVEPVDGITAGFRAPIYHPLASKPD
jgi:DNA (cytosine-5)-methyltransferase 1